MSRQNQWLAVRCCCTPKKVFGFIKLQIDGHGMRLPEYRTLQDSLGHPHQIKLMSIYVDRLYSCTMMSEYRGDPSQVMDHVAPEIAIYSDDRPIEFWRSIPGFVEAPHGGLNDG